MENVSINDLLVAAFCNNVKTSSLNLIERFNEIVDKKPRQMYNLMLSLFITNSPIGFIKTLLENDMLEETLEDYSEVLNFENDEKLMQGKIVFNIFLINEFKKLNGEQLTMEGYNR